MLPSVRKVDSDDNARTLQADESNEQSDTRTYSPSQHQRNGIHDMLAQTRDGEQDEDQALYQNCRQRKLPTVSHGQHHGVGEESIESHARSQGKRQFGIERHHQCTHNGRDTTCSKHGSRIHACGRKDTGIHGQDVGHCQKCGNATDYLLAQGHRSRIESKKFLYHTFNHFDLAKVRINIQISK